MPSGNPSLTVCSSRSQVHAAALQGRALDLLQASASVHRRTYAAGGIVTQLVTHSRLGAHMVTACLQNILSLSETVAKLVVDALAGRSEDASVGSSCGQDWWSGPRLGARTTVKQRLTRLSWTGCGCGIGAINYAVRTRCAITFFLFTIIFFRRSLPGIRVFQSDYRSSHVIEPCTSRFETASL